MFGDGITQGSPVSSYIMDLFHPFIRMILRSHFFIYFSLTQRAISPMVIRWHKGMDAPPTNVKYSTFRTGPSKPIAEIGFGLSSNHTGIPASEQASMQS